MDKSEYLIANFDGPKHEKKVPYVAFPLEIRNGSMGGDREERTRTHIPNGLEVLGAPQEVPQVPTGSVDRIRKGLAGYVHEAIPGSGSLRVCEEWMVGYCFS
jgi:hypothetical protein